ncbi:MAG: hypothetical protein GX666_02545 [Tissierellia bacterium]|nr:hypothetical protein [Tissierellia bacterium]
MKDIVKTNGSENLENFQTEDDLMSITEEMLLDAGSIINNRNKLSVPIAELSALGAGVSSLVPELNSLTQTTTFATDGLYQLINGEGLKTVKNGNHVGYTKSNKLANFKTVDTLTSSTTVVPINPAMILMAVALFSIEKELSNISEMGRQIISFLEIGRESEIEADVETLMNIINKYKFNWDNENFVSSNHKLVLDIQRTARKNINSFQKKINNMLKSKQFLIAQNKVNSTFEDLEKKFKYYRLSLYTFSLASFMEIMLSGNFMEEYIKGIKLEIIKMSEDYRNLFEESSIRLEKIGNSALDINVLKGIGTAGKAAGKFIGKIPIIKEGLIDELLQEKGTNLLENVYGMKTKAVRSFANISNPGTGIFVNKMDEMIKIYNYTSQIYFDDKNIYLISD